MELIAILIIVYALHSGIKDARAHWGKSKSASRSASAGKSGPKRTAAALHHDTGYWASQALHGFPQVRHGVAAGWHAGRQAQDQIRGERERAKADHLETRRRLIPEIQEHRKRQRKALDEIRRAREPEPESVHAKPDEEAQPDRPADSEPEPAGAPTYSYGRADLPSAWPTDDPEEAHSRARQMSTSGKAWVVTEYPPGGGPGKTIATYLNGREAPEEGSPGEREGSPEDTSPAPETEPSSTPTEGSNGMSADTTYDGVLAAMDADRQNSEYRANEQSKALRQAQNTGEAMQALNMDAQVLGAMADHLDAQQDAFKAQQRCMESAEHVSGVLKHNHQQLSEAHKDAPVPAADKEFYQD